MEAIINWIQNHEVISTIIGTIAAAVGGMYIPGLRSVLTLAFRAAFSEAVLKRVFIALAEGFAASTQTDVDDIWVAEMKKKLEG